MCDVFCSACYERNASVLDMLDFNFRYGTQVVRCRMLATDLLHKSVIEVTAQQTAEMTEAAPH